MVWAILYAHREKGINRADLIEKYRACSGKSEQLCQFDIYVVCSAKPDGSAHRLASRASDCYYCLRENNWIKLVLVGEKKG